MCQAPNARGLRADRFADGGVVEFAEVPQNDHRRCRAGRAKSGSCHSASWAGMTGSARALAFHPPAGYLTAALV